MATGEVHAGDWGTLVGFVVRNQAGALENLSSATTKEIKFTKPDGSEVVQTAVLTTDGLDGKMHYIILTTDLAETDIGRWVATAWVEFANGGWWTDRHTFRLLAN